MKIKFVILAAILILLVLIFNGFANDENVAEFKPLELELGEEFTYVKYDKPKIVLNYGIFDATGDEVNDMIIVVGESTNEEGFYKNIDIVVYNCGEKTFSKGNLKKCEARITKLENYDLNADGVKDIVMICESPNSMKMMRVITYKNGETNEIFGIKENKGIIVQGVFLDGFKADINIKNLKLQKSYNLDEYKDSYIKNGFYAENGKLLSTTKTISSSKFTEIEFVELSNCYGIKTKQNVKGVDNFDVVDKIETLWKFEGSKWIICEISSGVLGNLLY